MLLVILILIAVRAHMWVDVRLHLLDQVQTDVKKILTPVFHTVQMDLFKVLMEFAIHLAACLATQEDPFVFKHVPRGHFLAKNSCALQILLA